MVADLQQFFDPAAGETKDFDGGPGPERVIFFVAQVAALAGTDSRFIQAFPTVG